MTKAMRKVTKPPVTNRGTRPLAGEARETLLTVIDDKTTSILDRRSKIEAETQEMNQERAELLDLMEQLGDEKVQTPSGHKIAVVVANATHYNEDTLRKRLGASMWNKVTTRMLDRNKLAAFVKSGEIAPADVAAATTTTAGKPSLRLTKG